MEGPMSQFWQWQWIGILIARLTVGLLFAISGVGKLFVRSRREQMRQTLIAAHIPLPRVAAIFVSSVEFVFGAFLVFGFVTALACLMLGAIMVVALSTTVLPGIKERRFVNWLGAFLYLPEVLYVVILLLLFFSEPGWLNADQFFFSTAVR
jgi:putative oxidoreductase